MKKYIYAVVFMAIGVCFGSGGTWLSSHVSQRAHGQGDIKFEALLRHSNVQIGEDRFHCEGASEKDVAAVVGSILDNNDLNVRNKMSLECWETWCVLQVSDCKPWQDDSCGSRVLRFKLNENKEIIPSTFECIDVP